jgi:hypothetical protein
MAVPYSTHSAGTLHNALSLELESFMLNRDSLEAVRSDLEEQYQALRRKLEQDYEALQREAEQQHHLDVSAVEHLMRRLYGSAGSLPNSSAPSLSHESGSEVSNTESPSQPAPAEPQRDVFIDSIRSAYGASTTPKPRSIFSRTGSR